MKKLPDYLREDVPCRVHNRPSILPDHDDEADIMCLSCGTMSTKPRTWRSNGYLSCMNGEWSGLGV